MNQELSKGKKVLQVVGYAFAGFGGQIPKTLVDTFCSVFLVTAAGLSAGHIAVMLLITKIVDAISDYLIGIAIDATKAKMGRNRLWMLISIPLTFAGVVALFTSPSALSYGVRLAWAYLAYILVTTGLTCASVAANAIVPFLASDPGERGFLVSAKLLLSMVGSMAITGVVSSLVQLTGGADAVSGYVKAAVAVGVIFSVITFFSVLTLHEKNYEVPKKENNDVKSNPIKDLGILFKTKNYVIILIMGFCCMLTNIAMNSGAPYYAGYVLGDDALTGSILMPIMGGSLVPMILMGFLSKKFSKKKIVTFGSVAGAVLVVAILVVGAKPGVLNLVSLLEGITFGMAYVTFFTMQPDVVDEVAYNTGRVMAGLQSSIAGFACNLGSALAASMLTGLIGLAGYDSTLGANQNSSVLTAIKFGAFIIPAISMVVIAIAIQFYDMDGEKANKIRAELNAKGMGHGSKVSKQEGTK